MAAYKKAKFMMLVAAVIAVAAVGTSPFARAQSTRGRTQIAARQEVATPSLEPSQIDLKRSRVFVYVDKTGLGHEHGIEGKIKAGAIQLGSKADAGSIEFDMTSFTADTDRARKHVGLEGSTAPSTREQVNKNMLGADVLNVRKYPTATFAIASALHKKTKQGKAVVELKGEFTLHGKTRPLTLYAQSSQTEGRWNLRCEFMIRQTEFGITPYRVALGTVGVADQLKIFGDLWIASDETTQD